MVTAAFARGSSELEWCEPNYHVLSSIAEFYNTISNVLFFVYPPILMMLYRRYAAHATPRCHLVWLLQILVGLTSVYFHATLSLAGQLLDQISIVWVIVSAMTIWWPKAYIPQFFQGNRESFNRTLLVTLIVVMLLSTVAPVVNDVALFTFAVPLTYVSYTQIRSCKCPTAKQLGLKATFIWVLAVTMWMSDKFQCDLWTSLNFPYLHSLWHLCVATVACQVCVFLSYTNALTEYATTEKEPVLHFWPRDSWHHFGIPYVSFVTINNNNGTKSMNINMDNNNGINLKSTNDLYITLS